MRQLKCLSIHLLLIVFIASHVYAGGGQGGQGGSSRAGSSSYHGGHSGGKGGHDGGKYSGYSYPSEGHKGYSGKSSGYSTHSKTSKTYGEKSQQIIKGEIDSTGDASTIKYGQGTLSEECRLFLDEVSGPRREFASKRSAYFEARENPNSNPEEISRQQSVIRELFRTIEEKNTHNCRWVY